MAKSVINKFTVEEIMKMAKELEEYAELQDSFTIEGFTFPRGMIHSELKELADLYPTMSQAYIRAKERIGTRIAGGAIAGKYSPTVSNRFISYYLRNMREQEIEDYKAERKVERESELELLKSFASEIVHQKSSIIQVEKENEDDCRA